jgi:transcriptional regulator with PAS, ATPase and Fis domain
LAKPDPANRNTWTTLFQQTSDAVFLLNPRRRIRYVNPAWESLTKTTADTVLHEYCHPQKWQQDLTAGVRSLLQLMAPPKEVLKGQITKVRRPIPPARFGPPWWDVSFIPLREGEKLVGILGVIVPSGVAPVPSGGKALTEKLVALRQQQSTHLSLSQFASDSPLVRRMVGQAELAAQSYAPLWIMGARGTGKETLARCIHHHGISRERSFVGLDCAGLQPYLLRSLLFGHNGLAETGLMGTLYLKSPESLPTDLQVELIQFHESSEQPCRVVVGTTGAPGLTPDFRATFGLLDINLPPLFDLRQELQRLLLARLEAEAMLGHPTIDYAPEVLEILKLWSWPGNYREFREVIHQAAVQAAGGRLEITHLPSAMRMSAAETRASLRGSERSAVAPKLDEVLEQVEKRMIELALRKSKGDQTAAAESLGIHRSRIVRRIKVLGLGDSSTPDTDTAAE